MRMSIRQSLLSVSVSLVSANIAAHAACRCMALPPSEWKAKATSIHVVKIESRREVERFTIDGINRYFARHEVSFKELDTIKGSSLPFSKLKEIGQEFHCEPRLKVGSHYIVTMRQSIKPDVSFCDALPADKRLIDGLKAAG
jgi:hypothetical protein